MAEVRRTWVLMAIAGIFLTLLYSQSLIAYLQQRYPAIEFPNLAETLLIPSEKYQAHSRKIRKSLSESLAFVNSHILFVLNENLRGETAVATLEAPVARRTDSEAINPLRVEHPQEIQVDLTNRPESPDVPVSADSFASAAASFSAQFDPPPQPAKPVLKHRDFQNFPADDIGQFLQADDRFLFIGDSLMQGVAPTIRRVLCGQRKTSCEDLSKPSTGLSHKSFHDWPAVVAEKFSATRYTALFVFMGANDPWDFFDQKRKIRFDSDEWSEIYGQRVAEILQTAANSNAEVYWIGLPNMQPKRLATGQSIQNRIFERLVREKGGIFIDTHGVVDDGSAAFSRSIRLPSGRELVVRNEDGVHFTLSGQQRIGSIVLQKFVSNRKKREEDPASANAAHAQTPS